MNLLIIAGMPASGKTTVSQKLSDALGYPILEKDALKEELFDTVGFENYAEKRRLDTAACAVLLRATDALLAANTSLILVNNFREDAAADVRALLEKHKANCVTLFFKGDGDVFYRRYVERDLKGVRHLGHVLQEHYPPPADDALSYTMTREEFAEKLAQKKIAVRAGLHCAPTAHESAGTLETGTVRISFGHDTSDCQTEQFLQAVKAALKS